MSADRFSRSTSMASSRCSERETPPDRAFTKLELVDGVPHLISLPCGDRLQRLSEHFELVWATGWEDKANFYLPVAARACPSCHMSASTAPSRAGGAHWKLGPLDEYGHRPADGLDRRQLRRELLRVGRAAQGANAARPDRDPPRPRGGPRRGLAAVGCVSRLSPMEGFLPIFFLLVVLKIPVLGALWLIWWASQAPEPETASDDSGGGFNRWRPTPKPPRPSPAWPKQRCREEGMGCPSWAAASCFSHYPLSEPRDAPGENPSNQEGHPIPSPSHPLSSPLPLPLDLPQIRLEVDLDRVPLGGHVALAASSFPPPRSPPASPLGEGSVPRPSSRSANPLRLRLGERHDRAERLDEADEVEAWVLDRGDPPVEREAGCPWLRPGSRRRRGR